MGGRGEANMKQLTYILAILAGGLLGHLESPVVVHADPPAVKAKAGPFIELPKRVEGPVAGFLQVRATTNGKAVEWYVVDPGLNLFPVDLLKDTRTAVVSAPTAGQYRIVAFTALADVPARSQECLVVVGTLPPVPPGPTPPVPPGPTPPAPPGPAPIAIDGLAVLIVEESADRSKLTPGQHAAIFGKTVRSYLDTKCAADPYVPSWKAYRIWDKDTVLSNAGEVWEAAMKRERKSLPWLVVSSPSGGFEGPLPEKEEDTLAILKKFGG